ncbi:AAA family ATPase [Nocardia panacis]|nr:AAA family ATPase [Nocardia panacis]
MSLRTRKPTGKTPWPFILVEGGEKTGKSWAMAELTASDRIGRAFWLDLGEGAADEYAAIPGADYEVIEHNGTYRDIYDQLTEVRTIAAKAAEAGELPVALLIDSMTAEWELLKDWVSERARESKYAKKLLRDDPNAEIKPAMNLWNDAAERHGRLMRLLMTFPGIVVVTARGKEVAALDNQGKPIPGSKDYKVEGHKNLAFDASAWVRLSRDTAPRVIGVRSVHAGIRPGVDKPVPAPSFTLEWLIFDVLKCHPTTAKPREYVQLTPDQAQEAGPVQENSSAAPLPVADRARAAVGRQTARPITEEDEQRANVMRATIERADVNREELQAVWKAAGDLPQALANDIRAMATDRSKTVGTAA